MPIDEQAPLAVLYEHPDWFRPLFAELERRSVPHVRLHADDHRYDPTNGRPQYALLLNRMSPSAPQRGRAHAVFYTLQYLDFLERMAVPVVNGRAAYEIEISKARQLALLRELGLSFPPARVIHAAADAPAAADGLRYPVVVKPNIGGSGAGVRRFESRDQLEEAARAGALDLGIDHTALVQEFVPQADGRIVRVEVLGGRFLYGIRVYSSGETFNLCPADVCQTVGGAELERSACAVDAPRNGLRVEGYTPPTDVIREVECIARRAGIDVGGIEYMIDERDGRLLYYDVNALSNFVADAPRVVGFDPFARLVDYLIERGS